MALEDKFLEELEKGQKFTQGVSSLDLFSAWENDTETLSGPPPDKDNQIAGLSVLEDFQDAPVRSILGTLYNTAGRGLWRGLDEASFGLIGLGMSKAGIDEPFDEAEGFVPKAFEAVGSMLGFIAGAPMKVGAKIAQKAGAAAIRKTGRQTTVAAARQAAKGTNTQYLADGGKKLNEIGLSKEGKGFVKNLGDRQGALSRKASWNKDIAENWTKHSSDNIDASITKAIKDGIISKDQGRYIADSFKASFNNGRPLQDYIDVVMRQGVAKWGVEAYSKEAFAIGSIAHEAVMFGAIDALMEGVYSEKEERAYDWTAPIWGVGTGVGFGLTKFMNPAGKGADFQSDMVGGIKAAFNRGIRLKGKDYDTTVKKVKQLGEQLENSAKVVVDPKTGAEKLFLIRLHLLLKTKMVKKE